jgi:hypothetical protein
MGLGGNPSKRGLTRNRAARFHRAFLDLLFAQLDFAQLHYDSGAKLQVILAVVETVGNFGHEVLGLHGTNGNLKLQAGAPNGVIMEAVENARSLHPASLRSGRQTYFAMKSLFRDENLSRDEKLISRMKTFISRICGTTHLPLLRRFLEVLSPCSVFSVSDRRLP